MSNVNNLIKAKHILQIKAVYDLSADGSGVRAIVLCNSQELSTALMELLQLEGYTIGSRKPTTVNRYEQREDGYLIGYSLSAGKEIGYSDGLWYEERATYDVPYYYIHD